MRFLIFGDIHGTSGIEGLKKYAPILIKDLKPNYVIANAENIAKGKGIRREDYNFLMNVGIDFLTMGNHTFDNYQIYDLLKENDNIIRPYNFDGKQPGIGTKVVQVKNKKIRITNMMGKVFMADNTSNPFLAIAEIIEKDKLEPSDFHIIDFHAETTAEKIVFSNYVDSLEIKGIVYGTHTHVQTADEKILPNGLGFITDIGMTGAFHSSIGVNLQEVMHRFVTGLPARFREAEGVAQINGILIDIDDETNKLVKIERILITPQKPYKTQK